MRKAILLALILASVALGYTLSSNNLSPREETKPKAPILKFALVADSHNQNDLLTKALGQAKNSGASFVIGLGDWSNVGTLAELSNARKVFDDSGLNYFVTAGDHDLWDSRNQGADSKQNFNQVFGKSSQVFDKQGVQFVILDNSDIYLGISQNEWQELNTALDNCRGGTANNSKVKDQNSKLCFVFAHKTPFHPQSSHVMGEGGREVASQANRLIKLIEDTKVDGFFSGDLHFFAQFNSPASIVKMTTIGAVASEKNFQGPRFAMVTVYSDWSWEVSDIEVR